jgi:O-methyltransferase involved in polyketide biosynthesis
METKENTSTLKMHLEMQSEYFKCFRDEENSFIICESLTSYLPVEEFKEFFEQMTPIIKEHQISKFIFDKRSLRAFHQPTMEWYFVEWKQKLMDSGLTVHRKILPDEGWFKKAVQAGRASIEKSHPDFPFDKLDIQYFNSIDDCIRY